MTGGSGLASLSFACLSANRSPEQPSTSYSATHRHHHRGHARRKCPLLYGHSLRQVLQRAAHRRLRVAAKRRDDTSPDDTPQGHPADPEAENTVDKETELIFRLERRGSGWAEEIFPHIVMENRQVEPPRRRRRQKRDNNPDPWELLGRSSVDQHLPADTKQAEPTPESPCEPAVPVPLLSNDRSLAGLISKQLQNVGSLERFLQDKGVPMPDIEKVVVEAVAWRVTPGGRPLIDRRRRARVERNMKQIADYLVQSGVPDGADGVGTVLARTPQILLCKPSNQDRWDRRVVELAAFRQVMGHANVPEEYEPNPELAMWAKRQRLVYAQGNLADDRQNLLTLIGFAFGEIAQLTDEWEAFFDQLLDLTLWHKQQGEELCWDLLQWGLRGGNKARRVAVWASLQREFRRRELLPMEAVKRLETIGFAWEQPDGDEEVWLGRFAQLTYLQEEALQSKATDRRRLAAITAVQYKPTSNTAVQEPPLCRAVVAWRQPFNRSGGTQPGGAVEAHVPQSSLAVGRGDLDGDGGESRRSRRAPPVSFSDVPGQQLLDIRLEPGLGTWLAKQRWCWRRGRLDREKMLLLSSIGVDMDIYGPDHWQGLAKGVAAAFSPVQFGGSGPVRPQGSLTLNKLQMQRWVLTQNALWQQKGLSPGRVQELKSLGIAWVLVDEVVRMGSAQWLSRLDELKAAHGKRAGPSKLPGDLRDWLHHQRCLEMLNLLPPERAAKLALLDEKMWGVDEEQEEDAYEQTIAAAKARRAARVADAGIKAT